MLRPLGVSLTWVLQCTLCRHCATAYAAAVDVVVVQCVQKMVAMVGAVWTVRKTWCYWMTALVSVVVLNYGEVMSRVEGLLPQLNFLTVAMVADMAWDASILKAMSSVRCTQLAALTVAVSKPPGHVC